MFVEGQRHHLLYVNIQNSHDKVRITSKNYKAALLLIGISLGLRYMLVDMESIQDLSTTTNLEISLHKIV